jgi:hypothetical protein
VLRVEQNCRRRRFRSRDSRRPRPYWPERGP